MTPPRPPEGKHSPLPWSVRYEDGDVWGIDGANEKTIVVTDAGCYPPEAPDAEFICKAVNLHAKLVAALEMITERYFDDIGRIDLKEIEALLREAAK